MQYTITTSFILSALKERGKAVTPQHIYKVKAERLEEGEDFKKIGNMDFYCSAGAKKLIEIIMAGRPKKYKKRSKK